MIETRSRFITYYRVSTQKQGASGLGLEAQKAAVTSFVKEAALILGEFVEVESGKKNHRPQLHAAIAAAQSQNATLLIAKLDRLSRNAGFIFALRDAGVSFVCCDMPDANSLTVGLFAVIAQHERETISKRVPRMHWRQRKPEGLYLDHHKTSLQPQGIKVKKLEEGMRWKTLKISRQVS